MRTVLFPFLLASLASAQDAPKPARVEGSVRSTTGEPVQRATVTLAAAAGASYRASTDLEGKFVIDNIPPAENYQLTATRTGYVRASYGSRTPEGRGVPLALRSGQLLKDLTIAMTPQGVVSGRVTDPAGDPVQNVMVMVLRAVFSGTTRELQVVGSSDTDDRGEYRIANLPPGRYYVSALDRQFPDRVEAGAGAANPQPQGTNITTFYPSAAGANGAAPLDIAPGSTMEGIDIRLREAGTYRLSGKTVDAATGVPVSGIDISSLRSSDAASRIFLRRVHTESRSDGTFEFTGVSPGAYALQVMPLSAGVKGPGGRADVTITNDDVDDVTILLRPGGVLNGTARLEGGDIRSLIPEGSPSKVDKTLAGVNAYAGAIQASKMGLPVAGVRPSVELTNVTPGLGSWGMGLFQDDGTFQVDNIPPSRYLFRVELLPPGVYVKAARFGTVDALRQPLDLIEGGGTLDLVLSDKAAEVTGSVRNDRGEAQPNLTVTLWPRTAELGRQYAGIRTTVTDQAGSFRFRTVPPGDYYVAAWERVDAGLLGSHLFLSLFNTRATELKLTESAHAAVDAKLILVEQVAAEVAKLP